MTPLARNDPAWTYWQGRSLRAGGSKEEADQFFAVIAAEPSFYGKLALEELGRPIAIPPRGYEPTPEDIKAAAANPGLQRAIALFQLDTQQPARRRGARGALRCGARMDLVDTRHGRRKLLAAAEFARANEMFDRAINTADRTLALHDFQLRYLAPYRAAFGSRRGRRDWRKPGCSDWCARRAASSSTRKSSAGAAGLMQLMPATASWVAQKHRHARLFPGAGDRRRGQRRARARTTCATCSTTSTAARCSPRRPITPGRAARASGATTRPLEGAIYAETDPVQRDARLREESDGQHHVLRRPAAAATCGR